MAGSAKVYIFSGTILQSVQAISGASNQVIPFTANATEQTIVIHSSFTGAANLIDINSINVTAAIMILKILLRKYNHIQRLLIYLLQKEIIESLTIYLK